MMDWHCPVYLERLEDKKKQRKKKLALPKQSSMSNTETTNVQNEISIVRVNLA